MNLSAPTQAVFWIAVVIVVIAIIATFVTIPVVSQYAFWVAVLGFVVLAGGNLLRGT